MYNRPCHTTEKNRGNKKNVATFVIIAVWSALLPQSSSFGIRPAVHKSSSARYNTHLKDTTTSSTTDTGTPKKKKVVIIGAGWGGLSAAHRLSKNQDHEVTLIDASPRVGGVVRDGYRTKSGTRVAEAGQHGFWDNYHNIFRLLSDEELDITESALTGYDEQGQYSPKGLEAVWPVYRDQTPLPTGLAQAAYTKFENLPLLDRISAFPLVLAFSEFDDSKAAWERYDDVSFRDLCTRLGVSRRCYEEAFEPMILTGLFAPGAECSAAAALGMAYFFVLKSQNSFDVRWCKGNIGEAIFDPWVKEMQKNGVNFMLDNKVVGFHAGAGEGNERVLSGVRCQSNDTSKDETELDADVVVFAVGAAALNNMVRCSPVLSEHAEFRRYANLRGTSVLATRLYLDKKVDTPYSANACWGFDRGVGMTFFDIGKLHGDGTSQTTRDAPGSVMEVDYYHANPLLVMSDDAIIEKVKDDLDTMLGKTSIDAKVIDAAVVRLPSAVNWYYPGSYADMPDMRSAVFGNTFFVGDLVRTRHGSWSQEKAYVTGIEAANTIMGRELNEGVIPLCDDEIHVAAGRAAVSFAKRIIGGGDESRAPSLVDFLW